MTQRLDNWIHKARWAASGGNAQPWRVRAEDLVHTVFFELSIRPDYQPLRSPMDFYGQASFIALGGLAKNLEIIAANEGFNLTKTTYNSKQSYWESTILLQFKAEGPAKHKDLENYFLQRASNRWPLSKKSLAPSLIEEMKKTVMKKSHLQLHQFGDNRSEIIPCLKYLETVRSRNELLFNSMLKEISFFAEKKKHLEGLPDNTLGVDLMTIFILSLCKKSDLFRKFFMNFFSTLAIHETIVKPIKNCSMFCFLTSNQDTPEGWFDLGRTLQDLWLNLADQGVALQIFGLPLIAYNHLKNPKTSFLNETEASMVEKARSQMQTQFSIDLNKPCLGFRIGYTFRKARLSPRRNLSCLFEKDLEKAFQ